MKHTVISSGTFYKGVTVDLKSPVQSSGKLTYEPGTTVTADGLNEDPRRDCGAGINFCRTLAEALRFGPKVVTLTVAEDEVIIDTGGMLRAKTVTVGEVVDLTRADLAGAYLAGANLAGANLAGANLAGAYLAGANGKPYGGMPDGWKQDANGFWVKA